jgi:hypothetical protein
MYLEILWLQASSQAHGGESVNPGYKFIAGFGYSSSGYISSMN